MFKYKPNNVRLFSDQLPVPVYDGKIGAALGTGTIRDQYLLGQLKGTQD